MTDKELFEEFKRVTHFDNHDFLCKYRKVSRICIFNSDYSNPVELCNSNNAIIVSVGGRLDIPYFHDDESIRIPETGIGDLSDGYHTFNQLYHQRAILFATIVNQNKDKAWKSLKHDDGKYCFDSNGEWFIVGIDTPEGPYTYHYEIKYWDYFNCIELPTSKPYDGHTEEDVTRLLSLL